ncbi:hypothetical protein [Streptomyces sp. NPDC060001]|uniref:hypothetical protein n=1 Tax=Streptomyces sp. NPDC060001 TaxID=3347032 RepID=UPI00369619E1
MPAPNERFDQIIGQEWHTNPTHPISDTPYGPPAHPTKTGLTPRGKAALAFGATVIAGGSLFSVQHYSAVAAENQAKAAELSIQQDKLELQKIRELNRAEEISSKKLNSAGKERQKHIDSCVNANKSLVGKQLGATYRSVLDDCQAQYPATEDTSRMEATGSATDSTSSGSGGINPGLLVGGGVLALGLFVLVKKSTKSHPA